MSILKLLNWIKVIITLIIPFSIVAEVDGKPGPDKRKQVVDELKAELTKLGFTVPSWLQWIYEPVLGLLVDAIVYVLNKQDFFDHGSEPLS